MNTDKHGTKQKNLRFCRRAVDASRQADGHCGSAISAGRPLNGPSMQGGPFPYAEEAERARGRQKFRIEPLAIIADAQGEPVAIGLDRHLQDGCIRVTNDVGEDFLEDAEDGQGRLGGKTSVPGESSAAATNSGAGFEFLELPVEGRRKPEIFENSGAHLSDNPADRVQDRKSTRLNSSHRCISY